MQLSVGIPSYAGDAHAVPPERLREYVRLAEDCNFAGAWLIDHFIEPPTYATSMLDPLATLSFVAGETATLPLGTSILSLPLRDPVMVAKRAATLQHLSNERLTLGLSTGYVDGEYDAVDVPIEERSGRFLEGVELVRRLFDEDVVTFDGEFYSVDEFRLEPTPGRRPRLLAGGGGVDTDDGRRVLRSVRERLQHTDGWIAPPRPPDVLESDWRDFAEYLDAQGRDSELTDKVVLQYLHLAPGSDRERARRSQRKIYGEIVGAERSVDRAAENWLTGTVDDIRETLAAYERQGFDEAILHPLASDPADLERQLRLYQERLHPEFR